MRNAFRISITIALIFLLATVAFFYYGAVSRSRNLARFLQEIASVEIGKTRLQDWRDQVAKAHISNVEFQCEQEICGSVLLANNSLLDRLGLAPLTNAQAGVAFQNGIAFDIYVIFATTRVYDANGNARDDKGVVVRESFDHHSCEAIYNVKLDNPQEGPYWVTISMGSCTSQESRAKALALNTACLTKIG